MAKRLLRIPTEAIREKWPEVSGKKVNIVLANGVVLMVVLQDLTGDQLKVTNMRLKTHTIAVDEVAEIILDY